MSTKRFELRNGYTLIEILLAVTLGLILMLGVVQMFAMVGNFVTSSQGLMELDQKVRSAQMVLQNDLARYTAKMSVPADPNASYGYFRIEEKIVGGDSTLRDSRLNDFYSEPANIYGDNDDVLSFTIHDLDSPFIGRSGTTVVHSPNAEVKWFVSKNSDGYFSLYRRLIVLNPTGNPSSALSGNIKNASLSDLAFYPVSSSSSGRGRGSTATTTSDTTYRDTVSNNTNNADAVLDNILMFDVKVWDPEKKEYVDLGTGTTFSSARVPPLEKTFDTGSRFKVNDTAILTGINESGVDTNKVINASTLKKKTEEQNNPVIGLAGISLQGIQIHVRTFDPTSGIIRDFTVEQEFVTH